MFKIFCSPFEYVEDVSMFGEYYYNKPFPNIDTQRVPNHIQDICGRWQRCVQVWGIDIIRYFFQTSTLWRRVSASGADRLEQQYTT